LIYLGGRQVGIWRFVSIASLTGGIVQLLAYRVIRGEIRTAFLLPWRLWSSPLFCFVIYGLAWPCALVTSKPSQVGGVNLINYLWPILTVVFCAWWVPGLRLNAKILLATGLALAGMVCANVVGIRQLFGESPEAAQSSLGRFIPYGLASVAAVTWAIYSTMLVRWRAWAGNYVTSPIGFIAIGIFACLALALRRPDNYNPSMGGLLLTVLYVIGPVGACYLLWELALAKANAQTLSLLAATIPVLSTILLCCLLRKAPDFGLAMAAILVSGGVWISFKN
jgi:drug/metabolite transporter (DMT)-like permease